VACALGECPNFAACFLILYLITIGSELFLGEVMEFRLSLLILVAL
jgi:hypothetical protein